MGIEPPLIFGARPEALAATLAHGCRSFLQRLRLPLWRRVGLPVDDVAALEEALRQFLYALPLHQALDVLHTQLLSGMCLSLPSRSAEPGVVPFASPPCHQPLCWPPGTSHPPPAPPSLRCWITRRISPNMAIADFRCDSVPWATSFRNLGRCPCNAQSVTPPTFCARRLPY